MKIFLKEYLGGPTSTTPPPYSKPVPIETLENTSNKSPLRKNVSINVIQNVVHSGANFCVLDRIFL